MHTQDTRAIRTLDTEQSSERARQAQHHSANGVGRTRALGWLSLGLGVAELAAPGALARLIGAGNSHTARTTLMALGLREIGAGLGIFAQPASPVWLWGRVAGDVVDLAL